MELNLGERKKEENTVLLAAQTKQSCRNTSYIPGITMHHCPKEEKLQQEWVRFFRRRRPNYKGQSKYAALCSLHFNESSFSRLIVAGTKVSCRRNLIPGAVPTRDSVTLYLLPKLSQRDKRQVTT